MLVVINKSELLDKLSLVERAIPGRANFALIDGIYVKMEGDSLTLCANNLEMAIKASTGLVNGEGGEAVIFPKRFIQIAKQLPGDKVEITVKDDRATVKSGNSVFKLNCINAEEFPLFDESYQEKPFFEVEGQALKEMFSKTAFCVAIDMNKQIFQGVLMQNDAEEGLTCIATDTYRLSMYEELKIEYPEPFEIIVPGKLLNEVGKIIADNDIVRVYVDGKEIFFTTNDYKISCGLLNGKFPDLKNAFPKNAQTGVKVNKHDLSATIGRAMLLSEKGKSMVSLSIGEEEITVKTQSESGAMNESLPIGFKGETIEQVLINGRFLVEGMKAFDKDDLTIWFSGDTGPVVIGGKGFKHLMLPIKLA